MKSARYDRLLASTALVLVLALSGHVATAQQTESLPRASVPVPDTSLPPPLTAKDVQAPAKQATKEEPKPDAAAPASEPTKSTAAAAPTPDSPVGEKLRDLITGRQFDRLVSRKADRAGIEAFYSGRNYAPLWVSNNIASERAKAAIAYLGQADAVGLDPADYATPDFKSAASPDALAEAELKLTVSALTFARHAQIGRIHFTRVGPDIQYDLAAPEPADVLAKLADGNDAAKVLDAFNPPQAGFKALKAKLAEVRKAPVAHETKIAPKPLERGLGGMYCCRGGVGAFGGALPAITASMLACGACGGCARAP